MSTQKEPFIAFLKEIMRRRKRLPSQLATDLVINHSTVGRWLSGADLPSLNSCRRLAEYSGVPVERKLILTQGIGILIRDAISFPEKQ